MSDSDDPFILKDEDLNSSISYNLILHRLPPKLRLKIISPPQDPIDSVQNIYDVIKALINRRFSDFQINDLMLKTEIGQDYKRQGLNFEKDILRVRNAKSGETEIAEQFSKLNTDYKYCADWGKWLCWNQNLGYWQIDTGNRINKSISDIVKEMEIPQIRRSANLVKGIEYLLQSENEILTFDKDWDANLWLITTPNGTIDLKTGKIRPTFKNDLITKITNIYPKKGPCKLWLKFLLQATGKDKEYVRYLQRVAGYCLTGMVNEHALFFLYGSGGNGKGVFLNTITNIIGDYAKTADMSIFTESKYEQHSTGLAHLRGARLVTSQETEAGKSWKESLIKALTSDDPITARFMRQDFFTFQKQCKLLIAGNHEPQLRNVDEAMRRRFNKLPFTFKPDKPNKYLLEELKPEYPQILQWMIEGCKSWKDQGLNPPQIVVDATKDYMEDHNYIQQFLDQECEIHLIPRSKNNKPIIGTGSTKLFIRWCSWASKNHLPQGKINSFNESLKQYGFIQDQHSEGRGIRGFLGIRLKIKKPLTEEEKNDKIDVGLGER